ncbi:MAG TPA: DNA-processing protein DprA [Rhabdaerophilum sp.]|nr:DNA-processing protein DprA [Rhabdaerophilum sp.]
MKPRAGIRLSEAQRLDWLRLARSEGIGPRTFHGLINRFGGARAALEALPDLAAARGRRVTLCSPQEAEREFEDARRLGARLLASGEEDYPARLLEIPGPPPILSVRGRVGLLEAPSVGLVGARNASASGRKIAARIAECLGRAGYAVVSGLARGIDAEAHHASLVSGTIAVLAGGLDKPYPPENRALYDEIAEKGIAVSEMPFGLSPRGRDFPRRNRLISGLSLGIVVIEAARRSGSLITARLANEQGREVFAVPGSPLDPRCEGSNDLLREGATIVTSAEDILNVLAPLAGEAGRLPMLFREPEPAQPDAFFDELDGDAVARDTVTEEDDPPMPSDLAERVLGLLSVDPVEIDLIVRQAGANPREVQAALMEIELGGLLARLPGNRVARKIER